MPHGPGERGKGCYPKRNHHRQPAGENHGKRGPHGYDAGKKVSGRKRNIVVDTTGLLLAVVVHAASIQDRDEAKLVLARLLNRFPRLQIIWADAAYAGKLIAWAWATGGWLLQLVRRSSGQPPLRGTAPPVGSGAHTGLAEPVPTAQQRLRRAARNQRDLVRRPKSYLAMVHLMLKDSNQPNSNFVTHPLRDFPAGWVLASWAFRVPPLLSLRLPWPL